VSNDYTPATPAIRKQPDVQVALGGMPGAPDGPELTLEQIEALANAPAPAPAPEPEVVHAPDDRGRELIDFLRGWPEFRAASWAGWRERVFSRISESTRELWVCAGRGAGKTRSGAVLALYAATRQWPRVAGERIYVAIAAPDRKQAQISYRYIRGLIAARPELESLVENETRDSIDLSNGITIEVITASLVQTRGRSYACFILEEAAFLQASEDDGADNRSDQEIIRAIKPGLARVPGSLLVVLSSPWARKGALWGAHKKFAKTGGDDRVLYVQASTIELNPVFDQAAIAAAYADDSTSARTEYGAEFRSDIESFVSVEVLDACTVEGRRELGFDETAGGYLAFVDPAGGSGGDSMTLAISHRHGAAAVLDAVVEVIPPFKPSEAVAEMVEVLARFDIRAVVGDRYAGDWPRDAFAKHNIGYEPSERSKSEIYTEFLPLLNGSRASLLDLPRLRQQLLSLERRTARGTGRESIDAAGGRLHDDVANAVAGALVLVAEKRNGWRQVFGTPTDGVDDRGREWRGGRPWAGVFEEFASWDSKRRCVKLPPTYRDGKEQPLTAAEITKWNEAIRDGRLRPPRPPLTVVWG
jgi:hypothetical protein